MRQHQNMVFSVAVRLLGNHAEAADICQETFLRAHTHFASLEGNPAAHGWLRTVATNLCLNHLRRHRARWRLFSDMRREESSPSLEEQLPSPDTRQEEEERDFRRRYLEAALSKLPDAQRVPLVIFLGFLWAGWSRHKQSWHDLIAGTVIVRVPQRLHP